MHSMARELTNSWMVVTTRANGGTTKSMGKVFMHTVMVICTRDNFQED
jgi:hypothetical protein